jgi:hypothetical protein
MAVSEGSVRHRFSRADLQDRESGMNWCSRFQPAAPVAALMSLACQSFAADAPNILWVVTGDQRVDLIAAFNARGMIPSS